MRGQQQLGPSVLYVFVHVVDGAAIVRLKLGQIEHGAKADYGQRNDHQHHQTQFTVPPGPPAERHGGAI